MTMREELLLAADKYLVLTGKAESTLSLDLFGRGTRLADIRGGKDLGTVICERALHWLNVNWPRGQRAAWPRGVRKIVKAPAHVEAD